MAPQISLFATRAAHHHPCWSVTAHSIEQMDMMADWEPLLLEIVLSPENMLPWSAALIPGGKEKRSMFRNWGKGRRMCLPPTYILYRSEGEAKPVLGSFCANTAAQTRTAFLSAEDGCTLPLGLPLPQDWKAASLLYPVCWWIYWIYGIGWGREIEQAKLSVFNGLWSDSYRKETE